MNWIVHIILLVLGEMWSKASNLTSLLLVDVFAEVAQANAESLNIKSYQPRQKTLPRKGWGKMYFHIVTSAFYLLRQKSLKFEGCWFKKVSKYTVEVIIIFCNDYKHLLFSNKSYHLEMNFMENKHLPGFLMSWRGLLHVTV